MILNSYSKRALSKGIGDKEIDRAKARSILMLLLEQDQMPALCETYAIRYRREVKIQSKPNVSYIDMPEISLNELATIIRRSEL